MLDAVAEGQAADAADAAERQRVRADAAEATLEETRIRLREAEAAAKRAAAEAAEAKDSTSGEAEANAKASADALSRRHAEEIAALRLEAEETASSSAKKDEELARLRRHLLDMEEEDDARDAATSERHQATLRAREEAHARRTLELETALSAAEREAETLREASVAKDTELANLQLALEHFDGEAEDGERRALESAALREKNATLGAELHVERERVAAANARSAEAETRAEAAERVAAAAKTDAQKAVVEATRARQALRESVKQAKHLMSETSEVLDKRIVAKLLLTYFERDQSPDVLELMARVLTMSEAEKATMGLGPGGRARRGVLGTVAAAPARLVVGALGIAGSVAKVPVAVAETFKGEEEKTTVADQWVDFLLQQMDAEDEDEEGEG